MAARFRALMGAVLRWFQGWIPTPLGPYSRGSDDQVPRRTSEWVPGQSCSGGRLLSMSQPIVLLLSGPNLNLLGERQPEVYGTATLDDHVEASTAVASARGLALEHVQSNHEGELVDAIHAARGRCAAIVVNPGAFTHYAWAIHDALTVFDGPVVELHLSNPASREPWRHTSVVAPVADGTIAGFGPLGYRMAIDAVASLLDG